jgi:hypothetical protein
LLATAVVTDIYLCASCSCHEINIEERNGPGQACFGRQVR